MEWKLKTVTWRPTLMSLVPANSPEHVMSSTKEGLKLVGQTENGPPEMNTLKEAVTAVCALKVIIHLRIAELIMACFLSGELMREQPYSAMP